VVPEVVEGQMKSPRVIVVVSVGVCCFLLPMALRARQGRGQRQTGVPAAQALLDAANPPSIVMQDQRTLDARNQLELRMNVQRLYALATELKDDMDHTNSTTVLSVTVLQRARDIEKLAKQIKESARK